MDKSNVIVYAEGLAKEKNLSNKQKDELIETLNEATSVLNDDQKRIEEVLTFLDDKIQNSYKQFFTDTGIVATEIKSTTMIKVEKIVKEVEQIKIAQERVDRQSENNNETQNSNLDKAMNMEVKEIDLFNLPEKEVRASIKGALTSYFGKGEFSEEIWEKLSEDVHNAKKIDLEIEEKVANGEKREDVEAKLFPDEESRLKHGADVEIYDETAQEEYVQITETIAAISAEYGITFQAAEVKFFNGKPDASRYKYMIEQRKYNDRVRELRQELEESERIGGVERTEDREGAEDSEGDKHQSYTLSGFGNRKFDKCAEYIESQQNTLQFWERRLERAKRLESASDIAIAEEACKTCQSNIESYQKMLAKMREKSERREARLKEDIEFYEKNKVEIERLMREESLTVEAAASKLFGYDFKTYGRYIRVNAAVSDIETRRQKETIKKEARDKFKGLAKRDIARYTTNQNNIIEIDKKIAELEGFLAVSRSNGNSENIAMFEKQIAEMRAKRENSLRKITELEAKSNNITGKNPNRTENGGQTRGTSQLVVEEIETGGENKKSKPFGLFKGLFGKRRTIQAGVKSAYDDLAVAQTAIKSQEAEQEVQSPQIQDNQPTTRNNNQQPKQGDKGPQDEQVL